HKNIEGFVKGYLSRLLDILKGLDIEQIKSFAEILERMRNEDRTIFIAGNGGSAATASHITNDFGVDVRKYAGTNRSFRVVSLTSCVPSMLAIANDESYESIFVNQLAVLFRPGDAFWGISASGNSPNIVKAAKWAKKNGGIVLAFTGFDGGKLMTLADAAIHVSTPKGDFGHVEDVHMAMNHLLANWFAQYLKEK
ncbi:MAG: SIS domain-containing protein, partial [Candidatus Omnitrophota bacterium]|nr:SIS domain-containing protein [Candidatus Omnitrophota bacterium]